MPPTMTEVPSRTCPHCGFEERSERERCSRCGRSVLVRAPRLRGRRRTLVDLGRRRGRRARRGRGHRARAQRRGLQPQRPRAPRLGQGHRRRARAPDALAGPPPRRRHGSWRRPRAPPTRTAWPRARRSCAPRRPRSRATPRARARSGELKGTITGTECGPLLKAKAAVPDDRVLSKAIGRYDCVAVTHSVNGESGQSVGRLGFPFVAALDFKQVHLRVVSQHARPGRARRRAGLRAPGPRLSGGQGPRAGHGLRGRAGQLAPGPSRRAAAYRRA